VIDRVLGHYRVLSVIGQGGMGVVYRAHDELLNRDVAVKVVRKDAGDNAAVGQNLLREARASSALAHPHICTIYDVGETEGELYIVMELIEGRSLREMFAGSGFPPESVIRYGIHIASALTRAHDRGILHRDLKSANVVVTPDGLAKVLDFGLATEVGAPALEGATRSKVSAAEATSVSPHQNAFASTLGFPLHPIQYLRAKDDADDRLCDGRQIAIGPREHVLSGVQF
jgi:serine/threonine protein kinase